MKKSVFALIAVTLFGCTQVNNKQDQLQIGVSLASITPEAGAYIAGDKNNRHFTGVHDSLYVKAVVLSDPDNQIIMLTFDCIGLLYPALEEIRRECSLKIPSSGINPSHIVMSSTHTHAGPDVVGIWGPDQMTSGVDSVYMNKLVHTAVESIVKAYKNKQSVKVRYAVAEFGEAWVFNISDSANLDRSLSVLQFINTEGKSVATLTNFACHPTIMDAATTLVSADYVSAFYKYLDQNLGGVNMFLQGAVGGWVQPEYEAKTFASVEKRGTGLGIAVETALKNSVEMAETKILFRSKIFNLPISNEGFRQLAAAGVISRPITDSVTTEVAWFSIGNAQFVTHPSETTPTHSMESKSLMKMNGPKIVMGLGMDALGYILTPDYYNPDSKVKHKEYLTGMSIDKEAGAILMKTINQMANEK